jgi:Response regulator containing CheY-like receiver, AAA-type ATPase, and DNA-binding domains
MDIQSVKRTFTIIGNDAYLDRAIEIAVQVAPTDLTVLIMGESGTGKEVFPKIIHQNSLRKHGPYFAINCGAIPEGTIDSELFGHEKGSFTGAVSDRKGYFEVADGGTLFLDEVAELPLSTQARLLRVLENGEYIKVGGSKVMKTNVRVVAATNVNLPMAIEKGKFREDLYYRLNTVPIHIPALRERKEDIKLLFRKFASDFAERYKMPPITLSAEALKVLESYRWDGNIRQLKNVTEQLSIIESQRVITDVVLSRYLPDEISNTLPIHISKGDSYDGPSDRDILYKVLFDMKNDIIELRKIVADLTSKSNKEQSFAPTTPVAHIGDTVVSRVDHETAVDVEQEDFEVLNEEAPKEAQVDTLSLERLEVDVIRRALEKHKGKRKDAAKELGISERTLYRKINEFNIKL